MPLRINTSLRAALLLISALAVSATPGSAVPQTPARTLLRNATIVDGTGSPAYRGDLLIEGDRIEAVGPTGSTAIEGPYEVEDLDGLVLAPGFIDIHNHSTNRLKRDPAATTQIAQGVTTIVVGADGSSPWPIGDYLAQVDSIPPALNVAVMAGHGTVRRSVMGEQYGHHASDEQVAAMALLVREAMEQGAFGLSTGLEYDPGFYSSTEELIALSKIAAEYGGFYMSHMRDEEEGVLDSIAEAIRIGEEATIPIQISHIKMGNSLVWGRASEALALIAAARERGIDITADQYPYTAWQSGLGIIVSSRRFTDPDDVAQGLADAGGAERIQVTGYGTDPSVNGMRLNAIAERAGKSDVEMYIEMMRNGGAEIIGHTMSEADVETFMRSPYVMTAADGGIFSTHPRGAGAFARVLGHYTRDLGVLTLEQAVKRGTSMPASKLGLESRGVIRPGALADLVAFDPDTITDHSTFIEPLIPATGVHKTWVNGVEVWSNAAPTGERPGAALRRGSAS